MSSDHPGTNERLRGVWIEQSPGEAPAGGCADDEEIWAASRGELPVERTSDLLAHSMECPSCARSFQMAAALAEEAGIAEADGERIGEHHRPNPAGRWWLMGLAAAALLTIVILPPVLRRGTSPPMDGGFREPEGTSIRSQLDETVPVSRAHFVLRWSGGPEGTLYDVEVATEDLQVVYHAGELAGTEHQVPEAALAGIPAGATLLWRVDAVLPDASHASSVVFRATLE